MAKHKKENKIMICNNCNKLAFITGNKSCVNCSKETNCKLKSLCESCSTLKNKCQVCLKQTNFVEPFNKTSNCKSCGTK